MRFSRFVTLLLLTAVAQTAAAVQFVNTSRLRLAENEAWERELWVVTETAEVKGVVNNDLFVAGNTLRLDGHFKNDLWALARDRVDLGGSVADHARIGGKVVSVEGELQNEALFAAGTVRFGEHARLHGGASVYAEDFVQQGLVEGHLFVQALRATIGGRIAGDVDLTVEDLVIQPGTKITGNLVYTGTRELVLDPTVQIGGAKVLRKPPVAAATASTSLALQSALYLAALLLGMPFVAFFPRFAGESVRSLRFAWWPSLLAGAVTMALLPLLIVFSLVTLIGIPLGLALAAAYTLFLLLSQVIVAIALGRLILRRTGSVGFGAALQTFVVGLFFLYLAALVPAVGLSLGFFVVMIGSGAMVVTLIAGQRAPRPAAAVLPPPLPPG